MKPGEQCIQFRWSDEPDRWRDLWPLDPADTKAMADLQAAHNGYIIPVLQQLAGLRLKYADYRIPGSKRPGTDGVGVVFRIGPATGGVTHKHVLPG